MLSHALLILHKSVFFEDDQIILVQLFHNSSQFRATKKCRESAIHVFSNPWLGPVLRSLLGLKIWLGPVLVSSYGPVALRPYLKFVLFMIQGLALRELSGSKLRILIEIMVLKKAFGSFTPNQEWIQSLIITCFPVWGRDVINFMKRYWGNLYWTLYPQKNFLKSRLKVKSVVDPHFWTNQT